jgi:glycosyltransferase involved in cell wall biosynthesis
VLTISLVTPSRNQSRFLEEAIGSVLGQGDPALEYVIADGA